MCTDDKVNCEINDASANNTHLLFLHVEVFDDDADEKVQSEEGAEDDEEDEVEVHPVANFALVLLVRLLNSHNQSVNQSITSKFVGQIRKNFYSCKYIKLIRTTVYASGYKCYWSYSHDFSYALLKVN